MKEQWLNTIEKLIIEDDEDFIKRKDHCLPKYLIKYRIVNQYSLDSLKNDTVWFDKPANFNDPYDCSITVTGKPFKDYLESVIKNIEEQVGKLDDTNRQYFTDFVTKGVIDELNEYVQNSCLVSCFTTKVDSMLMWSHYADCHSGFCMIYDISSISASSYIRKNLYPVIYSGDKFDISYYVDKSLKADYPFIASLCWKNKVWSYENEYRIVLPYGKEKSIPQSIPFIKPTYICLGSKISKENEDIITDIALDRDIKVFNMYCEPQKFKLEAMELVWKRRE